MLITAPMTYDESKRDALRGRLFARFCEEVDHEVSARTAEEERRSQSCLHRLSGIEDQPELPATGFRKWETVGAPGVLTRSWKKD